jgi:hypothetical protein
MQFLQESVRQELLNRGLSPDKINVIIAEDSQVATFLLYNMSGQIVGYQTYRPGRPKVGQGLSPEMAKYFTHVASNGRDKMIAVWGVENIRPDDTRLYVAEGIFDAIKVVNAGRSAIAILTRNPKFVRDWFKILNMKIIGLLDNDDASRSDVKRGLWAYVDEVHFTPDPYGDLGDMPQHEVDQLLNRIENGS